MRPKLPEDAEILAVFDDAARRPMHVSDVASRLGLPVTARRALNDALDAMASRGLLSPLPGSRYRQPRVAPAELVGRFTQNPRGFGFVVADDGGPDVFIVATGVRGAMHGDRVAVTAHQGPNGREGVISRIVERRAARVPGVLHKRGDGGYVETDDARIRGPIEVDSTGTALDGEAVVCEITRWPESVGELPVGRVRESLGRPGQLDVEVMKVLLREAVEETFPAAALAEADAFPDRVTAEEIASREDLRHVPLVTIDPDDARDHDDAVHVSRRSDGGYTALIAIADVAHYVRPGTALDAAAISRCTSIYLPDRAIPMLPPKLSSNLASLLDGEDRLTLAVEVQLAADGKIQNSRLIEGVMRCHAGLTYSNVAWVMGWSDLGKPSDAATRHRPHLEVAAELATTLRARRMRRGSMDFDLPEARVRFGPDGRTPIDIVQSRQDPGMKRAYNLVEELMLLANEVVAATCLRARVPTIFRVHGAPERDGLIKLATVARAHGFDLDPEDASDPKKLSKFVRAVAASPASRVLGMLVLRAMPQAYYSTTNIGHFGLGAEAYLHFTSPIRRYPDVAVHRVVKQMVHGKPPRASDDVMTAMRFAAAESSRLERRAMEVEREAMDLHRCVVAAAHLGEMHEGVVSGLSQSGAFVQIDAPFLDVMVRTIDVAKGDWEMDPLGLRLFHPRTGFSFALGDRFVVQIAEASMTRRTVYGKIPEEALAALVRDRPKRGPKEVKGKKTGTKPRKGRGKPERRGRR